MLSLVSHLWLSLNERPMLFLPTLCSALYFVALVGAISSVDFHTASLIKSPQRNFESLPSHITDGALVTGRIGSSTLLSLRPVMPNPAVDPARLALWTLRDEAAQRRSPLHSASQAFVSTRPLKCFFCVATLMHANRVRSDQRRSEPGKARSLVGIGGRARLGSCAGLGRRPLRVRCVAHGRARAEDLDPLLRGLCGTW
jgi:hypothetical protein